MSQEFINKFKDLLNQYDVIVDSTAPLYFVFHPQVAVLTEEQYVRFKMEPTGKLILDRNIEDI